MKPFIRLDKITRKDNELVYSFSSSLKIFKQDHFFIRYEGGTLTDEESINAIPFAAIMAPLSWMTGADLIVPELDSEYVQALGKARDYFHKWHSGKGRWSFAGRLRAEPVKNSPKTSVPGMLFSSGLDAITTFIRHQQEKPVLFSIFGMDIRLDEPELIDKCRKSFLSFASESGVRQIFIYTNLKSLIDLKKIRRYTVEWWGGVAHMLAHSGMVAPVSFEYLKTLFVASGHKGPAPMCCGSDVDLDNHVRWAGTRVEGDFAEADRTEKIPVLKQNPKLHKYLRVCYTIHLMDGSSVNCGRCEKCLRTICGLLLHGIDPNDCNIRTDRSTLAFIKSWIPKSHSYISMFRGDEEVVGFWKDLARNARSFKGQDLYGSADFFRWLASFKGLDSACWRAAGPLVYMVRAARWEFLKKIGMAKVK